MIILHSWEVHSIVPGASLSSHCSKTCISVKNIQKIRSTLSNSWVIAERCRWVNLRTFLIHPIQHCVHFPTPLLSGLGADTLLKCFITAVSGRLRNNRKENGRKKKRIKMEQDKYVLFHLFWLRSYWKANSQNLDGMDHVSWCKKHGSQMIPSWHYIYSVFL